jgi:hypothetical protein
MPSLASFFIIYNRNNISKTLICKVEKREIGRCTLGYGGIRFIIGLRVSKNYLKIKNPLL